MLMALPFLAWWQKIIPIVLCVTQAKNRNEITQNLEPKNYLTIKKWSKDNMSLQDMLMR